ICTNEKGKAIENVSVYVHDSQLIAITDENGCFSYTHAKVGDQLRFAHMAYEPTLYTIKEEDLNGKPVNISIKTKKHELHEVEVKANAPHIAFDNPVRSVVDYVICDDGIYMLAYRRKNSVLLHLSFEMDTLHELTISSEYKNVFKDFYGFVHVVSNDNACQVSFTGYSERKKEEMYLLPPISTSRFYELYGPIITASDSVVITGRYAFFGLEQYYYCVTPTADTVYMLHHIVDEIARDDFMAAQDDRFYCMAVNFFPHILYIFNPIFGIDNNFYLFAYTDCETIVFDAIGNALEHHPLTFHMHKKWNGNLELDKRWKKKMIADEARKEFYSYFVDDGLCTIMHIDLKTGTAKPIMDLGGYPFAEMIRVHDGVLYFLYPTGNNHRKALYQVKID
ncbi:MAG: carboxypeptidase-like regulatory domain-containing protein, partial [Prevotella sp.]|nr:carboxypeptidase-like regulatory domain-containing protein [Prevotella sp.]